VIGAIALALGIGNAFDDDWKLAAGGLFTTIAAWLTAVKLFLLARRDDS
jgi:hypothetical protein